MPHTGLMSSAQLTDLLARTFGFSSFRANQEAVCRAAVDGCDVLLVMPTGAGKSLCYQLPAIARGGTTLVVSPLIALMEDQVAKLAAQGLQVARIHSGRDRGESRPPVLVYRARAAARAGIRRDARQTQAFVNRHRRSPLHLGVGT